MEKQGLLLLNLGSPNSTSRRDVRVYLRQFLSDPRIIDLSAFGRWLLLNLVILPFRPAKAAEAYKKIWLKEGSPLVIHTRNLCRLVQMKINSRGMSGRFNDKSTNHQRIELDSSQAVTVKYAMRYQAPSIESAMEAFRREGVDEITVFPLFPQYSSAANGSAVEEVFRCLAEQWNVPKIEVLNEFYDHPAFVEAFADVGAAVLEEFSPDLVMFSFHGLPERHCKKSDESGGMEGMHCFKSQTCCDEILGVNRRCYRAQCMATARAIAKKLGLRGDEWEVSFQSRLGRTPWIKPYFDERLVSLAKNGVKKMAVFSPSFVADCLETLEEVEIRAHDSFVEAGGSEVRLVPSLNSNDLWVKAVIAILQEKSSLRI